MTRPESLFEAASYDLNKFRERRLSDRRFASRDTPDRRQAQPIEGSGQPTANENGIGIANSSAEGAGS